MSSNLPINKQIEKYIDEHSLKLHPVQDEIIKYNDTLGKKKKLQISINQCHFLYLVTKLFKPKEIEKIVDDVIKENPKNVELFKSGKDKLFGFFVGQVMKKTDGKANPKLVNDILKKKLN